MKSHSSKSILWLVMTIKQILMFLMRLASSNHQKQSLEMFYLFIYLLYLTLVYKIVENNSTNKYQQN